ncbi:unnamed protein product [Ixodes persulcatus]
MRRLVPLAFWLLFLLPPRHGARAQDTSAILSGILGSLTSTSKARGCPGECVHAITALLCDQVVDEIQCGASYLRCCVPKDFSLGGTAVETSAPLAEDETPGPTLPSTVDNVTSVPETFPTTTDAPPVTDATHSPVQRNMCPGVCVGKGLSQYCHRVLTAPSCGPDAVCCTSAEGAPQAEQPSHHQERPMEHQAHEMAAEEPPRPECPGSCVSPLLSILCDQVSSVHSCPSGGSCCVSTAAATTTELPMPACAGRCLPPFLSGVCQKPAQLVLRTSTCPSGTICCSGPDHRPGFYGPQNSPVHRPVMHQHSQQQQRPFGALLPPHDRPYHGPHGNDQLNAVIPVEQGLPQYGHEVDRRRPSHEHRVPPQHQEQHQEQPRPDFPPREVQNNFQGGQRPDKPGMAGPKRQRLPQMPHVDQAAAFVVVVGQDFILL